MTDSNHLVQIRRSNIHGKGCFALQDLPRGTTLTCHVLCIEKNDMIYGSIIEPWTYPWDNKHYCICIGFGSYLNGDIKNPNVIVKSIDKIAMTKTFEVVDDIKEGTELLLNYKNW